MPELPEKAGRIAAGHDGADKAIDDVRNRLNRIRDAANDQLRDLADATAAAQAQLSAMDVLTTKGDVLTKNAGGLYVPRPVGTNGLPLIADSTQATGLNYSNIGIPAGGTNATAKTAAFDNLSPLTTRGDLPAFDGANNIRHAPGVDFDVLFYYSGGGANPSNFFWLPGVRLVKATADETNSTTTLQDHTTLHFLVGANQNFYFCFLVVFQTAAVTTGINLTLNAGAAPTAINWWSEIMRSGAAGVANVESKMQTALNAAHLTADIDAANVNRYARLVGTVQNGGTPIELTFRFASEVGTSQVTIKTGSAGVFLRYT